MTPRTSEPRTRQRRLMVLGACVAVIWIYAWIVRPALSQLNNATAKEEYYNRQIDGFRAGQLAMNGEPDPGLARLENPYDPEQNRPYRLHDASYYKGKYYLYFGVTPALLLFLPYALLTGDYLWHHDAVLFFCTASFLTGAWLLCAIRRRYFPGVGAGVQLLGLLGLGLANGMQPLLRRPDVWEVPIACGSMLIMLAVAALWQAWHDPDRRGWWMAAASTAFGLAVGARPTLLFAAGGGLVIPLVIFWRTDSAGGRPRRNLLAAVAVPLGIIGSGLALYNYARFGSMVEFGQRYQLAGVEVAKQKMFSLDYCWFNFRLCFLEPVKWHNYFPFVRGIPLLKAPAGYLGTENPYGILTNVPLVWMALGLPLAWRGGAAAALLRPWCLTTAVVAAASALPLLFFSGAASRYALDFLPLLVLLGVGGCFALEQAAADRPAGRWAGRAGWGGLLLFSVAFNFFMGCEHGGWLRLRDPKNYSQLAHAFDTPVARLEKFRGAAPGPLELRVMLPPFNARRVEPLLVTGYGVFTDYVWIEYVDASHVRVGVDANHLRVGHERTGYGGPVSDLVPVDYNREHVLVIQIGSLWPPRAHPFFDKMNETEVLDSTTTVRVKLDDHEIVHDKMPAYDASPSTRWVGENPFAQNLEGRFTGRIFSQRTLGKQTGN